MEPVKEEVVYTHVWEIPIRIAHWVTFVSVVVLGITGYLIGNPSFSAPTEAAKTYSLGNIRFLHLAAAYTLISAFVLRIYWGLVGNRFSRWVTMLPITKKRWGGVFVEIKDLLLPKGRLRVYTGHSPLANIGYLILYLGVFFSIVTGLTLHAHAHYSPWWRKIAVWGLAVFGNNLNSVHFLHHLMLWFFALFVFVHLYLVIYTVVVSRTTEVDTMISGKKFVFEKELARKFE